MSNQPPDQSGQPPGWGQPPPASGWGQPPPAPPPGPPSRRRTGLVLGLAGAGLLLVAVVAAVTAGQDEEAGTRAGPATSGPDAAVPTSAPDPPTTEEPTTTTPEVSVGEVGDTLSVENADGPLGDITVTKVRSAARDPDPYIGERAKRGRFLIVTVSVKATGDGFDVNPFDFYARERGGRHVEEQCCADFGEELESLTLNEGERTDGVLVFDIRPGKASLVYAPNFDEEPIGEWELR